MKKLTALCACACLVICLTGCVPGDLLAKYLNIDSASEDELPAADKQRVYMDELTGRLLDFTGSRLTLKSEEQTYDFDVSAAALECADGMITGDEVSVIYEGQLVSTDTSEVNVLKVVDDFHKKSRLKDRTAHGKITALTPNTITIQSSAGKTATYPITGTEQFFQNGIQKGSWAYLHFKGKFSHSDGASPKVLNASHLKVLSISDMDPLKVPAPTPVPKEPEEGESAVKQFHAVIQNLSLNQLTVVPNASKNPLTLDLTGIPCHFSGGAAPGSGVTVFYTGKDFSGNSLDGMTLTAVSGDHPESLNRSRMNFTVSGTIAGATANTVTIQTDDGAMLTCLTANARNSSTGGLASGSRIRITFDPSVSRESNIYTSIKIEDA